MGACPGKLCAFKSATPSPNESKTWSINLKAATSSIPMFDAVTLKSSSESETKITHHLEYDDAILATSSSEDVSLREVHLAEELDGNTETTIDNSSSGSLTTSDSKTCPHPLAELKTKPTVVNRKLSKALGKRGYRLKNVHRDGTYSRVQLALHEGRNEKCAIKIIDRTALDVNFMQNYLSRELLISFGMKHPNIVEVKEIIRIGRYVCFVMEFAEGGDLLDFLENRDGPLTEREVKAVLKQLSSALGHCHSNNVAHRDLKCENILFTRDGVLKLTDIGLSRYVRPTPSDVSATFCGSLPYMAPEVLSNAHAYDPIKADVWSLGVILYLLLHEQLPFVWETMDITKVVHDQVHRNFKICPRTPGLRMPNKCAELLKGMLEPDVETRLCINDVLTDHWLNF